MRCFICHFLQIQAVGVQLMNKIASYTIQINKTRYCFTFTRTRYTQHDNSFRIYPIMTKVHVVSSQASLPLHSYFDPIWTIFFEQFVAFPWYLDSNHKTLSLVLVIPFKLLNVHALDTAIQIIPPYDGILQYKLWFWIILCATMIFEMNIFNMCRMCLI